MKQDTINVLMVCLGNICRSPSAEVVLREKLRAQGLEHAFFVDSAGTGDWHVGHPPDERAIAAGAKRRYDLKSLQARQVCADDFGRFDYVVAMDRDNLRYLRKLCPKQYQDRISLLMDHSSSFLDEVPDPYHSNDQAFDFMLDLVEEACENLLKTIVQERRPQAKGQ